MDKYNCFNNMQTSRYAAIKYAQLMANSNLLTLFNASTNGGWGVLTSMGTDGIIPASDVSLKVSRKVGSTSVLEVQPGVAITPDGKIAVNSKLATIDTSAVVGTTYGVYNLYIKHAIEYKMTGDETFFSGHTSSTIGTIEQDSCEFELTQLVLPQYVLLASILFTAGASLIVDDITIPNAAIADGTVIYPNGTTIAWNNISTLTPQTLVPSTVNFAASPVVLVEGEYLLNTGTTSWERGYRSTNAKVYYEGNHTMVWSPIVDLRQTNAYRLNISLGSIDTINSGVIQRGQQYRHIELVAKKSPPAVPTINTANSEVIWLNSHLAAGYLTADMISAYEEVQGTQESINNTLSMINQLKQDYAEAAGSVITQERLTQEIQRQQMALLDYRTYAANLKSKLATRTMDSIRYADLRQFSYAISITGPQHTDDIDEPVMYEVEVEYGIADSPKENVSGSVLRWFYSRRRNLSEVDWASMEKTYEDADRITAQFDTIYVPVKFGERIKYRVRAIGESGQTSEYSAYATYSFTGYTISQQYIMVNNIYNLLYPDPYQEGIITRELVDLLYSVIEEYRDKTNRIEAIENQVASLISEI